MVIGIGIVKSSTASQQFNTSYIDLYSDFEILCYYDADLSKDPQETLMDHYTDLKKFADFPGLDTVIITTHPSTYYNHALYFLSLGKHVIFYDPPLYESIDQMTHLCTLAKANRLLFTINYKRRWDGDYLSLQKIIQKGNLGNILEFHSNLSVLEEINADTDTPEYIQDKMNQSMCHLLDQAFQLFQGVSCNLKIHLSTFSSDSIQISIEAVNQCNRSFYIHLKCTSYQQIQNRFEVHGSYGSLIVYGTDPQDSQLKTGMIPNKTSFGLDTYPRAKITIESKQEFIQLEPGQYVAFYKNVADYLCGKVNRVHVDPMDAVNVLNVLHTRVI